MIKSKIEIMKNIVGHYEITVVTLKKSYKKEEKLL